MCPGTGARPHRWWPRYTGASGPARCTRTVTKGRACPRCRSATSRVSGARSAVPALPSDMSTVPASSAWSPLGYTTFRWLWLASIASNIGTWMHEVGAGWLMTSLSASPMHVALVQVVGSAPMFFLALPAGALADIVDRRRYLLLVQMWMAAVAMTLALLTLGGQITVNLLLLLTLGMGIGPAIAGVLVSLSGPWATFALNALSFFAVIAVLFFWRREVAPAVLPAERLAGAIRAGWRYSRSSRPLQAVMVRALAFFLGASGGMALLPLIVRRELQGSAADFGLLLGSVGVGAGAGALLLPRLRPLIRLGWLGGRARLGVALGGLAPG